MKKRILLLLLTLALAIAMVIPMALPVSADDSGWILLETLSVPAYGDPNTPVITSATTFASGQTYKVEVSGTYYAGGNSLTDIEADAEYSQDDVQAAMIPPVWTDAVNGYESNGEILCDLMVNGVNVEWGTFNPTHIYAKQYSGTGGTFTFQINDVYSPNNTGELTVKIYIKATIDKLEPTAVYNPIGGNHTVTATISPVALGVPVYFAVTGANANQGWATTNASGVATFTYTGAYSGMDTITATVGDSLKSVTKYWYGEFVTGGGTIGQGKLATWSLSGNVGSVQGIAGITGQIEIQNRQTGAKYHISNFSSLVFSGGNAESPVAMYDTATFIGTATDGTVIRVKIEDLGEPGTGVDMLAIDIGNTGTWAFTPSVISGGNYQVHDLQVPSLLLSGTWVLHVNSNAYNHDMYIQIQDAGGALTGQGGYPVTDSWPYDYPYNWTMTGQLTGINISMLITYENGYTAAITGTVASDGLSMSGGAGTGGVTNWTANRVP